MRETIINWFLFGIFVLCFITTVIQLVKRFRRANAVHKFRMMVIDVYPPEVYFALPSFDEMCEDGEELLIENYIENIEEFKEYQELQQNETSGSNI